ncbi:MAG: glycosyltransferase family 2 protein [Bacteroidia bacterium]
MEKSYISVIIPVFNSERNLQELFQRIDAAFSKLENSYQLILIDDGSSDKSWLEIDKLKRENPSKIIGIKLAKNFGQHNAILCGFHFCKGDLVLTMDDDLQHPPEEIEKLIFRQEQTNADVIYGIPINKKHAAWRNVGSNLMKKTSEYSTKKISGGSAFRLINRTITDEIKNNQHTNFLFLDTIINWYTSHIELVDVDHHHRKAGKSGYTFFKLIQMYLNITINYTATPLKLMTYGGLFFSIITFIFGVHFIAKKILHHAPLGYTSIIVSVLFGTSLILFCLGIIGQYLYKLYQLQNKKPPYAIQKVLK